MNTDELQDLLFNAWSSESSSQWRPENPARGQCGVTALVVQDMTGGEILRTTVDGHSHFYNRINGVRHDFTASQFTSPVVYEDILANREEAMADTNASQYAALSDAIKCLSQRP